MSSPKACPRNVLRRSGRKIRKLDIDNSLNISLDHDSNFLSTPNSRVEVTEGSRNLVEGHIDLFGELIPPTKNCNELSTEIKCIKTPDTKMEKPVNSTIRKTRKRKAITSTPRITKIMKESQAELYSMGVSKCSNGTSIAMNDSFNVSGIQSLPDSPAPSVMKKFDSNFKNNKDDEKSTLFEGIVVFVDFKINKENLSFSLAQTLLEMGVKIGKTFNLKVTHVVFGNGYRKTYTRAIERNIPLVSLTWIRDSIEAKKILDPIDYPPADIEKYSTPKLMNYDPSRIIKKYLRLYKIDELMKLKQVNHMENINNFQLDFTCNHEKTSNVNETTQGPESLVEEDDEHFKPHDMISLYSKQLLTVLNTDYGSSSSDDEHGSSFLDDETSNSYNIDISPVSIKFLRKSLTPQGRENKSLTELDIEINKIENRLKLNSQARRRFRKLLYPMDKELRNMSIVSEIPPPSPQELKTMAPVSLICTNKKSQVLDKEVLPHENLSNYTNPSHIKNAKLNTSKKQKSSDLYKIKIKDAMDFQTSMNEFPSIACTGLTKSEVDIIKLSIQNLGTYKFNSTVNLLTTYVVTKSPINQTLSMAFAMAFGCIIISEEWIHESFKIGKWLPYQPYLIKNLSGPVKRFQKRRQKRGVLIMFGIFDKAGFIYIANTCESSAEDLKKLIRFCGGHCTTTETLADVVVGYTSQMNNNVNEKWILDCVSQGKLIDKRPYMLVVNNVN